MPTEDRFAGEVLARGRALGHRYTAGEVALREVDVELRRGTLTVLLGANGAGKTTLLRILAGNLQPDGGEVEVLGLAQPARAVGAARRALRARSTYVPQEIALDPEMSGGECLLLMATLYRFTGRSRSARVEAAAGRFGITPHLGRRVQAWSGGLRRRLHLACGMLHDPELVLLDEPTAGLDATASSELWADLTSRTRRGGAVAVVTHELEVAERYADAVLILEGGELVASGRPADLVASLEPNVAPGARDLAEVFRRRTGRDLAALRPRVASREGERQ